MKLHVRLATPDDAQAVLDIYGPVIRDTAISFEYEPPPVTEVAQRIEAILARFPWLVAEHDGCIAGYAYAGLHRERAAYQWMTEVSAYVHAAWRRRGVARLLYGRLLSMLERHGYVAALAGITLPNAASVGLHESLGFRHFATYPGVGWKFDKWHDVGWWERPLNPRTDAPQPPIPFSPDAINAQLAAFTERR